MLKISKKVTLLLSVTIPLMVGCIGSDKENEISPQTKIENDVLDFVDPFIGTGGHGHTFPGATVPFGMVQLSPDNPSKGWDWTSGYHHTDDTLLGFSHTHLSGTGVGDLLDILVMPFVSDFPSNTDNEHNRLFAKYKKENEQASPGYYSVYLEDEDINAEMTATARVGVHRYTFGEQGTAQLLIDLGYAQNYDEAIDTHFFVEDDNTIIGYRKSKGWAKFQPVYFVAQFDKSFDVALFDNQSPVAGKTVKGKNTQAVIAWPKLKNDSITVKVGISYASVDGARKNIQVETEGFDFNGVKSEAESIWRDQLTKITVEDDNKTNKTKFYTAMYHSFLAPHLFSDANGEYYGADGKTHKAEGYDRYTLFSLWDTFRSLHALLTITNPEMVDDLVKSMMAFYDESGLLPTWDLMSNETDVMIGYHAVPVIVDAYLKGLTTVPAEKLLEASKASAMQNKFGIDLFRQYGYIPSELEVEAVSKTLEYAFDDWAIAQLANDIGAQEDYQYFLKRSQAFNTLFDASVGFMRGKDKDGNWVQNFSPTHVDHRTTDYTEANAWQYTWFVPHDVQGLIGLFGSEESFLNKLDTLFTTSSAMEGDVSPDISGLIGQYAHGNEPCHHIPYLYAFTNQKWKGEDRIREIMETMYRAEPDGLAGNDDVGQMSSWYVLSALGFYPVNPVDGKFIFGTPLFSKVTINHADGSTFEITQNGNSGKNYVEKIQLNKQVLDVNFVSYKQIMNNGELNFSFK